MPKTTCTEARAFIPSRAPLLAYRASEVVPPVGFAPSSHSCNAAPQAMLSKKERRESEWATGKQRSCEPCSCRGFAQGWCCVGSTSLGVRLRFSARAGRPSADKQGQSSRPCPRPRQAGHQMAAALQWMARAALHPFRERIFYFFFFQQAEQDFWVGGEEVQITRLLTESKKSAELSLKGRAHLGLHKLSLFQNPAFSVSLLQLDKLTELEKTGELSGTSASSQVISLAHVWWKCLVFPIGSADLIKDITGLYKPHLKYTLRPSQAFCTQALQEYGCKYVVGWRKNHSSA